MLEFVYVRFNWQCFGDHFFLRFCCKFSEKIFFYQAVNSDKPIFVSFLVIFGVTASVTAKISSFETVAKREAILNPVAKQWISKDIPSYGSQSERALENSYPLIWWMLTRHGPFKEDQALVEANKQTNKQIRPAK